uniref:Uncharacterized protein n=1 Tax=Ditylum brightwellii TaxID=49249 RepID=A0A7S4VBW2_9STRA
MRALAVSKVQQVSKRKHKHILFNLRSPTRFEITSGISPSNSLYSKCISLVLSRLPIESGMVPLILFESNLKISVSMKYKQTLFERIIISIMQKSFHKPNYFTTL